MIRIERTYDAKLIRSIMWSMWDDVAEDGQIKDNYWPDVQPELWLNVSKDDAVLGVYRLHAITDSCLQVHIQIKKEHRGETAREVQAAVNRWWLENLPANYQKLIAEVPVLYPNVREFILANGWTIEGINRLSIKKKGRLVDMWRFGITRSELAEFAAKNKAVES